MSGQLPDPLPHVLDALEQTMREGYALGGATQGMVLRRLAQTWGHDVWPYERAGEVGAALDDLTRAGLVRRAGASAARGRAKRWRRTDLRSSRTDGG